MAAAGVARDREPVSAAREEAAREYSAAVRGGRRQRHRVALERAASALDDAVTNLEQGAPPELVAVDIQEACDALDDLVGATTIEDVLDRLFGDFCIGK